MLSWFLGALTRAIRVINCSAFGVTQTKETVMVLKSVFDDKF